MGIHKDYILIESPETVFGVPMSFGSVDFATKAFRDNPRILKGESAQQLRGLIDGLVDPPQNLPDSGRPERKVRAYRGYDIYFWESRYFAIPENQAKFGIEDRSQSSSQSIVGHTIDDVRDEIERRERQAGSGKLRVLVIQHSPSLDAKKYLAGFQNQDITILPLDIRNPSPELFSNLRDQHYDIVIVPHEQRQFWDGVHLEQFTASFAKCVVNVFSNGRARMYRGEDVHRIQYNKAYLNSMFKHIPSIKGKRVLEVGCSDGLACDLLLCEEPADITGVDVMGSVGCVYKDPRIRYQRVSGSVLPFPDGSFDVSYSIATLEHCFDPFKVIAEMKRVTRRGGYCYIQAGPLYFSPFGHHMFGYFDDEPWVHLRRSPQEMVSRLKTTGRAEKIQREFGKTVEEYVHSMLNINHINGRFISEYGLEHFERTSDVEIIATTRSREGEDLLTDEIRRELGAISRSDLVAHGFELIFKKRA